MFTDHILTKNLKQPGSTNLGLLGLLLNNLFVGRVKAGDELLIKFKEDLGFMHENYIVGRRRGIIAFAVKRDNTEMVLLE